ncbi:hypothetical protein L0V05_03515 [Tabrizicola sp. J26]|uniref:hypothetical protein n=1 Tax=Alitabrizicola rongguiensis TaxID=2909234 RepID=UPI001F2B6EC0|nr:hypothetical protein [Tabrizicola rongguiensis]MCF1707881.1 hypothetical protein [Tabrizicola rongguiensis]
MDLLQLLQSQLLDPFRVGLIVALMFTQMRTAGSTGAIMPLAFGVLFVAVIAPMTHGGVGLLPDLRTFLVGIVSNIILLAIVYAIRAVVMRTKG